MKDNFTTFSKLAIGEHFFSMFHDDVCQKISSTEAVDQSCARGMCYEVAPGEIVEKAIRKGSTVKENPALRQIYGSFDAYGKRRFFGPSQNEWAIARGFPFEMETMRDGTPLQGGNTPIQFSKTRAYVCVDEDEYGEPVVEVWPIRNLSHSGVPNMAAKGWKRGDTGAMGRALNNPTPRLHSPTQDSQRAHLGKNGKPTKRPTVRLQTRRALTHNDAPEGVWANPLVRVKVKSPPQRPAGGKGAPSERLKKRRIATQKAPKGFYGNPVTGAPGNFLIQKLTTPPAKSGYAGAWLTIATAATLSDAVISAKAIAAAHPSHTVRVWAKK